MREGWEYKKLGDVCGFKRGLTYSGKDEVVHSKNIVLRSNNVDLATFSLNFDELKYISDEIIISEDKKLKKGTLLMCMSNGSRQHLGKVAFVDKDYPYAFGGFMGLLCPIEDQIAPKYLYYYCCSPEYKSFLSHIGNGANINNLKFSQLSENPIPLPPLTIQQSIVSELDEINNLLSLKQKELETYDKLAQSLFYEMFGDPVENEKGWEVKKLDEIAEATIGLTYKPENVSDEGVIVLRSGNIQDFNLAFDDIVRVNAKIPQNKFIRNGDILMCTRNGSFRLVGKVAMIQDLQEEMSYGAFMTIIRSKMNPYLLGYFKTSAFRERLIQGKTTTVNQITVKMLNEIKLPIPPLPLQQLFAQRIEAIEQQKTQVKVAIEKLQTLLAARMQYWFE